MPKYEHKYILNAENISKDVSSTITFSNISITLMPRDRAFLVGNNGSGKTTLLRSIMGLDSIEKGKITIRGRHFYISQNMTDLNFYSVFDLLLKYLLVLESSKFSIQKEGNIRSIFSHQSYFFDREVLRHINDLDIGQIDLKTRLCSLSAGQKLKLMFLSLLTFCPDFILLDEPTNHLDSNGCIWLSNYLQRFNGAALIVSHNRRFIEENATKILELDSKNGRLSGISRCYTDYRKRKEQEIDFKLKEQKTKSTQLRAIQRKLSHQQRIGKHAQRKDNDKITASFKKSKMELKKSRVTKTLKREIEAIQETIDPTLKKIDLSFWSVRRRARSNHMNCLIPKSSILLNDDKFTLSFSECAIYPGDRIFLLGNNGSGKSSFLRLLAGSIPHKEMPIMPQVSISMLNQEEDLNAELTNLTLKTFLMRKAAHDYNISDMIRSLIRLDMFRESDLGRCLGTFSLGEMRKLKLLDLILEDPDILLLDEPTNYMDIQTIEATEKALQQFKGAIVIASHDDWLINSMGTRCFRFDSGRMTEVNDGFLRPT